MYYAMENIGSENIAKLMQMHTESEKWNYIARIASNFGFSGIQIGPAYNRKYGLSPDSVPDYVKKLFRLTYHTEGVYHLTTPDDEQQAQEILAESLKIASRMGAEDVSLHPPLLVNVPLQSLHLPDKAPENRANSRNRLHELLSAWLPRFLAQGITLSLETHVTSAYFIFTGIPDFQNFVLSIPGLGVLADISHNCLDGYGTPDLLQYFQPLRITGFHLSDAAPEKGFPDGTHIPIGQGHVDFSPIIAKFKGNEKVYGALEVRGTAQAISDSLAYLHNLEQNLFMDSNNLAADR